MVHGDRNFNQEAIANLNSNSPLTFSDALTAEELARDLDLFANTQFFDFDFGVTSDNTFPSLEPSGNTSEQGGDGAVSHLASMPTDNDLSNSFTFLSEDPMSFDLNSLGTTDEDTQSLKRPKIGSPLGKSEDSPVSTTISSDEAARVAAEEDKRRRNTLASARFRAKKKLREQALEKDHKEMTAKIERLENRIKELELENKWLRGLVTQK